MKNDITIKNLSIIGFPDYYLQNDGKLFKMNSQQIYLDSKNRYFLSAEKGKNKRITLKKLYRKVFNKEYCKDNILNLPKEKWKEIENTNGKYFVSNCGRVKSYCGYVAKILKPYKTENGYFVVKINDVSKKVHQLVAFAFCENKYKGQAVDIHHKDKNKTNNNATNLMIVTPSEHKKIHYSSQENKQ